MSKYLSKSFSKHTKKCLVLAAAAFCGCYVTNDSVSWYSRAEHHLRSRQCTSQSRNITCSAGLFMVSSRRPALVATAGLTSSTAVRKQQKACAREYFSRWFLVTEWISRNLQITATFSTAISKAHNNKKNDIYLDSLRNEPTEEKVSSGCPHTDLKYQEEISMPPFLSVLFICVAESISTQCSSFLSGSLDLVLGVFSLMVSTFV